MTHTYFLQTARIGFSTWTPDDIELATLLWGDTEVTRLICASGRFTENDIKERLNTEVTNHEAFHIQYWPIFNLSTQELIGCCGLRPFAENEYEIGFQSIEEHFYKPTGLYHPSYELLAPTKG